MNVLPTVILIVLDLNTVNKITPKMLRTLQKQKLLAMLSPDNPPFKILILDTNTQEILSPLLKVSDLRDTGVTAHFLASMPRTRIKEAPAFYFVTSMDPIGSDLAKDLYGSYYINSVSTFRRSDLESIAAISSECHIAPKVRCVFDRFLNFISLHEDFFTLNISDSFARRNEPECLRACVSGLMSIFTTFNELPFIISKEKELGRMLEHKIKNTKIIKGSVKKPLLIILNREFDVSTPTKHVMGYAELLHDIFNIRLSKAGDINIDTDSEFYKANMFQDFPTVADTVNKELHEYQKELALRSLTEKSDSAKIQAALESAPHIQKKGEIVNSHLTLCSNMLKEIRERKLDDFYAMEEKFDQNEIMELSGHGTDNDIIRLCVQMLGTNNADLIEAILQKRKISAKKMSYFNRMVKNEQSLGAKMKSFLFKKNTEIYREVESILSQVRSQTFEGVQTFDLTYTGIYQSEISRIIVFVNGGVTYSELKSLKELEKSIRIPIILGGSEILSAEEFIRQVEQEDD